MNSRILMLMLAIATLLPTCALSAEPTSAAERMKSCDVAVAKSAALQTLKDPRSLEEPLEMMAAASTLFRAGEPDDAVFWFYAGQLRTRDSVAVRGGDRGQLLTIFLMTIGQQINGYAFQDTDRLANTIEKVLKWDQSTPNPLRTAASSEIETKLVANRDGLRAMQTKLRTDKQLQVQARAAGPQIQALYAQATIACESKSTLPDLPKAESPVPSAVASNVQQSSPWAGQPRTKLKLSAECTFADRQLPADTVVIAAGAYSGKPVGRQIDQSGHEATQFDVLVHADSPIALLLSAYEPAIWNISWTEGTRIVAVYITGYHHQVSAGFPAGTPLLLSEYGGKCGYGTLGGDSASGRWIPDRSQAVFGREASRLIGAGRDGVIRVISSERPMGRVVTNSKAVPAPMPDTNAPLAGLPGLEQVVQRGLIRLLTAADVGTMRDAYRAEAPGPVSQNAGAPGFANLVPGSRSYVILKPFNFPAGLFGAHAATFVVPKGVPMPTGEPGHSTVIFLSSFTCRGTGCE